MKIIQSELGKLMDTENFFVALYNAETDNIHLPYYQDEKDDVVNFPAGKTLTGMVIKSGQSLLINSAMAKKLEEENLIEKVVTFFLGKGENPCSAADALQSMRVMEAFVYGHKK